jgi:DNA repair protein SbcC/Rad50
MIPIKLTIKGLYSYIEKQTIEFNDLTGNGIFGIFGAVGSGKSTVLEAITFALYGETERLNSRDSRSYNMMNLKSQQLLIDFEFYTDSDNTRYRFIVKGKRNKNKFDDVKTFERSALIADVSTLNEQAQWSPTEKTAAEIIGLNYTNFKRTIIIPQGKFREFLELKPKDRTIMLNEIFNLDRFDLAPKLATIKSQNEKKLATLLGRLEQYQDLNTDLLKNKNAATIYLVKQEKEEQNELNKLQNEFLSLNKLKNLFANLGKAEAEFKSLNQSTDNFISRKKDMQIYSDCRVKFSQLFESETSLNKEIKQKSQQLEQLIKQLNKQTTTKTKLQQQLKEVKIIYDQKEKLIKEAEEIAKIITIRDAITTKQTLVGRIEKGDLIIHQKILEYEQTQQTLSDKQSELQQLKATLPNISELNNVKNYHLKKDDLTKQLNAINGEIKNISDDINGLYKKHNNEIEDLVASHPTLIDKAICNDKEKIDVEIDQIKHKKTELNAKLNHILAQEKLKLWADELVDGELCPVCGSKEHPDILNITNLESEILVIKQQLESIKKQINIYNDLLSKIEKLDYKSKLLSKSLDNKNKKKQQYKDNLLTHNNTINWASFDADNLLSEIMSSNAYKDNPLETVESGLKTAQKTTETIKQTEKILTTMSTDVIGLQKNIDKYHKVHQQLKDQYTALDATIENDIKKLTLLSLQQYENESASHLTNQSQTQLQQVKKALADFERISVELTKIQSEIDKTQGQEKILAELLTEKKSAVIQVNSLLQQELSNSKYTHLDEVKKVLNTHINELEENQMIADFEAKLTIASQTLQSLQKDTDGIEFNQEMFDIIKSQISNKESILKVLSSKIAVIHSEIEKLKIDFENKKQLTNEYQQLLKRKDNIAILAKLFKGQGFVRYISSVYLQNLSEAANERFFKMTKQQLQLEITEYNEFQVRDFLNEGKIRSIKTLSGGQMFQASLSLALALADSVQNQIKADQKFFFLDEGFGSLDNEALHLVFEALKSLKNENRIVGVISHVENLKQEIDLHLQVINDSEKGSLIDYSWV